MAKAQSAMAKQAGKAKRTDSPVASLETRTTTAAVRAAVPAGLNTGNNFTGQYLYDRFVLDTEKESASRMDIVRQMVQHLDVEHFKKVVADFVSVAKGFVDNAVTKAKEAGNYDEKNPPITVRTAKGRLKTSQNSQTVMRAAYGALKFAPEELAKLGGSSDTGYMLMSELAKKALENIGINWDGTKSAPKPTAEEKAQRQVEQETARLFSEAMTAHPQKDEEDRGEWFERLDKIVTKKQKDLVKERHEEQIKAQAEQVKAMLGDNMDEVIHLLLNPAAEPEADKNLH